MPLATAAGFKSLEGLTELQSLSVYHVRIEHSALRAVQKQCPLLRIEIPPLTWAPTTVLPSRVEAER